MPDPRLELHRTIDRAFRAMWRDLPWGLRFRLRWRVGLLPLRMIYGMAFLDGRHQARTGTTLSETIPRADKFRAAALTEARDG